MPDYITDHPRRICDAAVDRYFLPVSLSAIIISNVTGAVLPSFQPANDTVTFALPTPASAGTRTGP